MDDRSLVLSKLSNTSDFDKYLDILLLVYNTLNGQRLALSKRFNKEFVVVGGVLYFLLEREARHLNLISPSLEDHPIYHAFRYHKTVDIDIYADGDIYNEIPNLEEKFSCVVKHILTDNMQSFEFIHKLLSTKPFAADTSLPFNFGLNFADVESRRHLHVSMCVGKQEDHLVEILIADMPNNVDSKEYSLKCLTSPFQGEEIISSITQQIYPNERAWRDVSFVPDPEGIGRPIPNPSEHIYKQMKGILTSDSLSNIKFLQGYYRSYVVTHIYQVAIRKQESNLIKIITPSNLVLRNKVFYFKSRRMRLLASQTLINRGLLLYREIPKDDLTASTTNTLGFLNLCLDLWRHFNLNVFGTMVEDL